MGILCITGREISQGKTIRLHIPFFFCHRFFFYDCHSKCKFFFLCSTLTRDFPTRRPCHPVKILLQKQQKKNTTEQKQPMHVCVCVCVCNNNVAMNDNKCKKLSEQKYPLFSYKTHTHTNIQYMHIIEYIHTHTHTQARIIYVYNTHYGFQHFVDIVLFIKLEYE